MSQFQDIARRLTAAAYTPLPDGKSTCLLYSSEDGALVSKHWTGETFGSQEFVATEVRPGSTATYIITPATKFVACISAEHLLRALRYDEDEEEWADEEIPRFEVHPEGHVGAIVTGERSAILIFQDAAGQLVFLDDTWKPSLIPVTPIPGSPIDVTVLQDSLHIFYISVEDDHIHDIVLTQDGAWKDSVVEPLYPLQNSEQPKRILVAASLEGGSLTCEIVVLTMQGELVLLAGDRKSTPGRVTPEGQYVPHTAAECAPWLRFSSRPYYSGWTGYDGAGYRTERWYRPPPMTQAYPYCGMDTGRVYESTTRPDQGYAVNYDDGGVQVYSSGGRGNQVMVERSDGWGNQVRVHSNDGRVRVSSSGARGNQVWLGSNREREIPSSINSSTQRRNTYRGNQVRVHSRDERGNQVKVQSSDGKVRIHAGGKGNQVRVHPEASEDYR